MSETNAGLRSFPGRSWLLPDGSCQVISTADKIFELGISHQQVVRERCRRRFASAAGLDFDRLHWMGVLEVTGGMLTDEQRVSAGLHPDEMTIALQVNWHDEAVGDLRLWAARHWQWTRQAGEVLESWGLWPHKLRVMARGLRAMALHLPEQGRLNRQRFELRDLASGATYPSVSFTALEAGGPLIAGSIDRHHSPDDSGSP